MVTLEEFEKALNIVREFQEQIKKEYDQAFNLKRIMHYKDEKIDSTLALSVRAFNVLQAHEINTIAKLLALNIDEIKWRNCAKKTKAELKEIQEIINTKGVDVARFIY